MDINMTSSINICTWWKRLGLGLGWG